MIVIIIIITGAKLDKEHLFERVPGSVETNHE